MKKHKKNGDKVKITKWQILNYGMKKEAFSFCVLALKLMLKKTTEKNLYWICDAGYLIKFIVNKYSLTNS